MSQPSLLKHLAEVLDGAGIDYMVTGSIASSLHGEPRLTHDVDVVVSIQEQQIPTHLAAFARPTFYVDEAAAREAVRVGGMFNVIDVVEGAKIDFWMLHDEPFDRSRFSRKYEEQVFGIRLMHVHVRSRHGMDRHAIRLVGTQLVVDPSIVYRDDKDAAGWAAAWVAVRGTD